MVLKIIYEDENVFVIDKPAGIIVFQEKPIEGKTLIDLLVEKFPYLKNAGRSPRYGVVHRLDKETSGILLVAKNNETFKSLQKEFKERRVLKKYLALAVGSLKPNRGKIETLIGRAPQNPSKQKAFSLNAPEAKKKGLRRAITGYKVVALLHQGFGGQGKSFTLVEANPKTGRKHQIRCHFSYLGYPIAGDKLYSFKKQPIPKNLKRHFLHASYLKIKLPARGEKEFKSDLPKDLKLTLESLNYENKN